MSNYALILYRPSDNYAVAGFNVGSSESKFELHTEKTAQQVHDILVDKLKDNYRNQTNVSKGVKVWEFEILQDGKRFDFSSFRIAAYQEYQVWVSKQR